MRGPKIISAGGSPGSGGRGARSSVGRRMPAPMSNDCVCSRLTFHLRRVIFDPRAQTRRDEAIFRGPCCKFALRALNCTLAGIDARRFQRSIATPAVTTYTTNSRESWTETEISSRILSYWVVAKKNAALSFPQFLLPVPALFTQILFAHSARFLPDSAQGGCPKFLREH